MYHFKMFFLLHKTKIKYFLFQLFKQFFNSEEIKENRTHKLME